jgi:ferritin-like metal-binding protein YciE
MRMNAELEVQLIERLKDAHRIESAIQLLLEQMIALAHHPTTKHELEGHRLEARHHKQRLRERLQTHGECACLDSEVSPPGAGEGDTAPIYEQCAGQLGDGFLIARMKIATYELLEEAATQAEDDATARVARLNRGEDDALASIIISHDFGLLDEA